MFDAIIATLSGVVVGFVLSLIYEKIKSAKLKLADLFFESFDHSARVSIKVIHYSGSLPATDVVGFLTIKTTTDLPKMAVEKVGGRCKLDDLGCDLCGRDTYLASPKAGINSEPLPWSLHIPAGTGLKGLKLCHLTHIPVGGEVKLRLFDIYRVKVHSSVATESHVVEDEFWLVKLHSEYGDTHYPRICLKLPISEPTELILVINIAGENVRKSLRGEVEIRLKEGDHVLVFDKKECRLGEYFDHNNIRPLELQPRGMIF
jgi:hypothetical protein